jgi:hypothetical protein
VGLRELLRWQWEGYPRYHRSRTSLLLHFFSVPFFWAGTVLLIAALITLRWLLLAVAAGCMLLALIAQGRGHKLETEPPAKFTSPWNFIARFCLEQWVNFPRFLLSGRWWNNFRAD